MEYLTTHDLIWVNTAVTGAEQPFEYFVLEAAMAAQYSYGVSNNVPAQAASLLRRMLLTPPFPAGAMGTAFLATVAFLNANGHFLKVEDAVAAELIREVQAGSLAPEAAIETLAAPAEDARPMGKSLRQIIMHACNTHIDALKRLERPVAVVL